MKILARRCAVFGTQATAAGEASAQNSTDCQHQANTVADKLAKPAVGGLNTVHKTFDNTTSRMRRGLTKLAGVSLMLALGAVPALSAEDALLSRLEGEWIGQGTVQKGPTSEPERIYCKVANRLVDGGAALEQKGRCAVATNSGRLRGKIAAKGEGRYEGSLDSPQTNGPAVLAGHAENEKIVLSARFVDRFSKQPSKSTISLFVGDGDAYRLVSNMLNPGTGKHFQASNILFKPDKKG